MNFCFGVHSRTSALRGDKVVNIDIFLQQNRIRPINFIYNTRTAIDMGDVCNVIFWLLL